MKIAVVGPQFPDSFARNIVFTLERMGHTVLAEEGTYRKHNRGRYAAAATELALKALPSLNLRLYEKLIRKLSETRPDLVLVTHDFLPAAVLKELKKRVKSPVVVWYIDPIANLKGGGLFRCEYDAFFAKEPRLVEIMTQKLGLNAHYLPEACNPEWHRPVTPNAEELRAFGCDVVAQGTAHPYRMKFFEALTDFDVKIWGTPPPAESDSPAKKFFQGRFIGEQEKAVAFRSGKILVNSMNFAETYGLNNTLFEGAGCGAFQICDERPTLAEFFVPDSEVVTFRSRPELIEKIRYYLPLENQRKQISERAWQRAHREHTYERRLTQMLSTLRLA
jgi:spore maturation protein CgeB